MARSPVRSLAVSAVVLLAGACAHAGSASEPPNPPTIVDTGSEYLFEFVPPPGWSIPDAIVPLGAVRVSVGGADPGEAQASLMIRAVGKDTQSFNAYCDSEFSAMAQSFPNAHLDPVDVSVPGLRSVSRQISDGTRTAVVTLAEDQGHFVWFGLLINDTEYAPTATMLFRESVQSYKQTLVPKRAVVHPVSDSP